MSTLFAFTCSVCGAINQVSDPQHHRELLVCSTCGSNARFRAIACAIVQASTGKPGVLSDLAPQPQRRGIGISDTDVYAEVLTRKFSYTNTYLHTDPHVDIERAETFDRHQPLHFIVCSDVIEHTLRQPPTVLANLFDALQPGGHLVLSAPTYEMAHSVERYPTLESFDVAGVGDGFEVRYRTAFGTQGTDPKPMFHGGPGRVLELRVLSHEQLLDELRRAGFEVLPQDPALLQRYGATWPAMVERHDVPYPMNGCVLLARRPHA